MGGSRRELVRSLKFAFFTESEARRCQQWIKKGLHGDISQLVLPGAKLVVGNPMDPMSLDAPALDESHEQSSSISTGSQLHLGVLSPAAPALSRAHSPVREVVPSSPSCTPSLTPSKLSHISITGIDPTKSVPTVFSTILGSLNGSMTPARMGISNANGRRGAEFVFDSEAMAKQFVLQVWTGIKEGKYAEVTAEGEELKIVKGSTGRGGAEC
ncbi:hypothetical protein BCR44DRAFT_1428564 [Catenaria anguillulae PL171]|uniref:Uncharacterized protein n=1 Tax=Catenaria anguillulae PL171 TaxID=765915 RepID=A0A1Y2HVP4_9FUNG|nr:hypothetical protein BCR44DRAFT_1428564 [Catenaria anguillulae PL171]